MPSERSKGARGKRVYASLAASKPGHCCGSWSTTSGISEQTIISYMERKIGDDKIHTDGRFEGVEKAGEARHPAI